MWIRLSLESVRDLNAVFVPCAICVATERHAHRSRDYRKLPQYRSSPIIRHDALSVGSRLPPSQTLVGAVTSSGCVQNHKAEFI